MKRFIQERWPWLEEVRGMRSQLLDILSNTDLSFSPGGQNMTLGALLRRMGDLEHSYIQSLKTFKQDWSYHNTEAGLESDITRLKVWFQALDDEMLETISAFSNEDLTKRVDRGGFNSTVALSRRIRRCSIPTTHTTFALSKSPHKTRYPCRYIRIV